MAIIALTDDHILLRNGLAGLLKNLGHEILFEADNGKQFIAKLDKKRLPDIVMMDINMPEMDGYETSRWLRENHPQVKILALSMYDNEKSIIQMLQNGARGYILKDSEPALLKRAIDDILEKGYHFSDFVSGRMMHMITGMDTGNGSAKKLALNDRELNFLKFTCTEMTYKEIAEKMCVSPRTIDGYRDALLEKLHLKTRVGLAMYAIKNGLVDINNM